MKSVLFARIIKIVSEVTELKPEEILSTCKNDELVGARCLFVHFCASSGLPYVAIAKYMRKSKTNSINNYLTNFETYYRSSAYFRMLEKEVARRLSEVSDC